MSGQAGQERRRRGLGDWLLWVTSRGEPGQGLRLKRLLLLCRVSVRLVPAVRDPHMSTLLQQLRVDWPAASERASTEALRSRALAEFTPAGDRGTLPHGVLGSACLKELVKGRGHAAGYDPNLDNCLGRTWSLAGPERRGEAL